MTTPDAICPCDGFVHPRPVANPPGRSAIAYRVGDFVAFRHAGLLAEPGEIALVPWRPTGDGDLAVQIVEWWAYLADILTFYNERAANESFLRTAALPESVHRLIRLLGYRPRPGIAASATLAALVTGRSSLTLPAGFAVQSKPGPGKQPQIFELEHDVAAGFPDAVSANPAPDGQLVSTVGGKSSVLLAGVVNTVVPGDRVLLLPRGWKGEATSWALVEVAAVATERDPRGQPATRVTFALSPGIAATATAAGYRLLRSESSAKPWQYSTTTGVAVKTSTVDLEAIVRQIQPGDPVLLEVTSGNGGSPSPALVSVETSRELIWFANGDAANPSKKSGDPPFPVVHTRLTFKPSISKAWTSRSATIRLRFDWRDAGQLVPTPPATLVAGPASTKIEAVDPAAFPSASGGVPILLEDADGHGAAVLASPGANPGELTIKQGPNPATALRAPLRALFNTLVVSRGATVAREVLGSGDASHPGQELMLAKSPLTYLQTADSTSGSGYASTLRIWVDGIEWHEVPSFYDQPGDARVFATREDENGFTHVQFGDGVEGSRLPTGAGNVVARYRHGSGADAPAAGSLTVVVRPQPGLRALRNPGAAGGGADPDPPDQIRRYAPDSVLTFGRAVSAYDCEVVAAGAPGVTRAASAWTWEAAQQRAMAVVWVGDDKAAEESAKTALAGASDPNRLALVKRATAIRAGVLLAVVVDADRDPAPVLAAVRAALSDPVAGLFAPTRMRIGRAVFESEVAAAVIAVPGVVAMHGLELRTHRAGSWQQEAGFRMDPGEGAYFTLADDDLHVLREGAP